MTINLKSVNDSFSISEQVFSDITSQVVQEIEGVYLIPGLRTGIYNLFQPDKTRGKIEVEVYERNIEISFPIAVDFQKGIDFVCRKLQNKVKTDIEMMTGMNVKSIDIQINKIYFPKNMANEISLL